MSTCIAAREGKERDRREIDEDRALSYCDIVLLMSTRANNILVLRVFAVHLYKYKCVCVCMVRKLLSKQPKIADQQNVIFAETQPEPGYRHICDKNTKRSCSICSTDPMLKGARNVLHMYKCMYLFSSRYG